MSNCYEKFEEGLKSILNENIITKLNGNLLEICEEAPKATGNKVVISNITKSIALGLDVSNRHIYFLKDTTKINDHTIFCYNNGILKVVLIELKSRRKRNAKEQIFAGKAYVDFIINLLKIKDIILSEIEYRAFIFTVERKCARKQPTKKGRYIKADSVEEGIYFKELANNKKYNFCELLREIS